MPIPAPEWDSVLNFTFNPLNAKLNPICHLLALLNHHIFHVSGLRVKESHKTGQGRPRLAVHVDKNECIQKFVWEKRNEKKKTGENLLKMRR